MATAEELLQTLKSSTNSEAEGHIVIGNDRRVVVPASLKRIAVQYDHNIETVTFDCPRYWDGLDMSKMAIYVNYMRSDKYTDSYPVGAVTVDDVDPNIMHFDWTISRNVTSIDGGIVFLVCVKNTDEDGLEINHWNSELCKDLTVSPGMEADEQFIEYNYDLITQLLLEVESLREEVENIEITGGGDGRPEIYIGSGDMPEGYVLQVNPEGDEVFDVDQTYNPESSNAQSGIAVAEAFNLKDFELLSDITITEDVNEVGWNTTDSGEPLTNYKDFFIYFLGKHTETKSDTMHCRANDGGLYFMWLSFSKSTDIRGFWIMIEELIQTDKIEAYHNHATYKGTKMYKTTFPNGPLGNVNEERLTTQGLAANNRALYSDFTIGAINEPINKLYIGQTTSATSIFASGSRFLLFGRKS